MCHAVGLYIYEAMPTKIRPKTLSFALGQHAGAEAQTRSQPPSVLGLGGT